jgi:hypothetical protein
MFGRNDVPFSDLMGKTLTTIEGAEPGSDEIIFRCSDGSAYRMLHRQDCCENVRVEDVVGDPALLVGQKVLEAYEEEGADGPPPEYPDSWMWTFYTIRTNRATVVLRWLGESNGYYSEAVDFESVATP